MEVIIFIISLLTTLMTIPFVKEMLLTANITGSNYKGDKIPVGMGITFVPVVIINGILFNYFIGNNANMQQLLLVFLIGIMTMAVIGLIDDLIGNRNTLGFKGHIKSLLKGKLTTGGLKAIVGGLISILIGSLFSFHIIEIVVNSLIIALFTNLINLLDLRPGRAIKGFLTIAILFIIIGLSKETRIILGSIIAYAIGYFPQDIKAKSMMGDIGSNTLGITLGIVAVISYTMTVKYIILALLVLIQIIAEKYSITEIIKKNSILNFLDELGRY
ncbi:glycosyltransferase [Alkaliphilus sp. B6464]|uniref:glycosyltransferase n=1 Tax=Alkaliphilus sp. B6464 TaxID=2731219 RepID=UPI001BA557A6|nr:glycosyltransferase [Alkaliphilus sp. B6464]QUH20714.1 glycosyltransferase [Alkaliphilus sp. B6464]